MSQITLELDNPDDELFVLSLLQRLGIKFSITRKEKHHYTSSLDALIAIAKRLSLLEQVQKTTSEDFYHQYTQGKMSDDALFIEWANDYRHYLSLHYELNLKLKDAV